jgi:hypothetical protein
VNDRTPSWGGVETEEDEFPGCPKMENYYSTVQNIFDKTKLLNYSIYLLIGRARGETREEELLKESLVGLHK